MDWALPARILRWAIADFRHAQTRSYHPTGPFAAYRPDDHAALDRTSLSCSKSVTH